MQERRHLVGDNCCSAVLAASQSARHGIHNRISQPEKSSSGDNIHIQNPVGEKQLGITNVDVKVSIGGRSTGLSLVPVGTPADR